MNSAEEPERLEPHPAALAIALDLVTKYRLRLCDNDDSRLGSLANDYQLALAMWTGPRAVFIGFYEPPTGSIAATADAQRRWAAAQEWATQRLQMQGAQQCDVLLVALTPITTDFPAAPTPAGIQISFATIDVARAEVKSLTRIPRGLPSPHELRARIRSVRDGVTPPTLAAVDLAERQTVAGGYAQPVQKVLTTRPIATYAFIVIWIALFLIERFVALPGNLGLIKMGALINEPPFRDEWWRYVASAFLHDNSFFLHVGFNSLAMFYVGSLVEQLYGRLILVATFLLTAVVGSLVWVGAHLLGVAPEIGVTVGASGGICGLFGLLVMIGRVQGRDVPVGLASNLRRYVTTTMIGIVFYSVFFSPLVNNIVNNYAHAGGFIAGILLGLLLPPQHHIGGRTITTFEKGLLIAVTALGGIALIVAGVSFIDGQSISLFS